MSYLPTKWEVNLWTNTITVVIIVPLPVIWLKVLGSLRPGVLLATGSSVRIGLTLACEWTLVNLFFFVCLFVCF